MKTCLGLFILALTLTAFARSRSSENRSGTLLLRGRVPASTSINWNGTENGQAPVVKFNNSRIKPKVEISTQKDHKKITIIHP